MDDNSKNACSHQVDQVLLDERGINMTVEEVAGLSTSKYSERVQSLKLGDEDLAFLKGLRRRIKNRLASQNSRRRSVEHLRRLTRELRAVRACRRDALSERRALCVRRELVRDKCASLRKHLVQILQERSDPTEVPSIDIESQSKDIRNIDTKPITSLPTSVIVRNDIDREKLRQELDKEDDIYERVRKELQKEVEVKETVIINDVARETLIIKEETPDYEEITIEEDFESQRRSYDFNHRKSEEFDHRCSEEFDEKSEEFNHRKSDEVIKKNVEFNHIKSEKLNQRCFGFHHRKSDEFIDRRSGELNHSRSEEFNLTCDNQNYESSDEDKRYDMVRSESSDRDIFECKIGKLVTQSVNHMFNDKKKVFAKTVFIANDKLSSNIKTMVLTEGSQEAVLNLSVKEGRRKSHGRKQSAPRRIAYYNDCDDGVLDLKVKKEPQ